MTKEYLKEVKRFICTEMGSSGYSVEEMINAISHMEDGRVVAHFIEKCDRLTLEMRKYLYSFLTTYSVREIFEFLMQIRNITNEEIHMLIQAISKSGDTQIGMYLYYILIKYKNRLSKEETTLLLRKIGKTEQAEYINYSLTLVEEKDTIYTSLNETGSFSTMEKVYPNMEDAKNGIIHTIATQKDVDKMIAAMTFYQGQITDEDANLMMKSLCATIQLDDIILLLTKVKEKLTYPTLIACSRAITRTASARHLYEFLKEAYELLEESDRERLVGLLIKTREMKYLYLCSKILPLEETRRQRVLTNLFYNVVTELGGIIDDEIKGYIATFILAEGKKSREEILPQSVDSYYKKFGELIERKKQA